MIPFSFLRKILLTLASLALFYLLKKREKKDSKKKSSLSDFDPSTPLRASKSKIVEGEIVEDSKVKSPDRLRREPSQTWREPDKKIIDPDWTPI